MSDNEFLGRVQSHFSISDEKAEREKSEFLHICSYVSGQYDEDASFKKLNAHLDTLESDQPVQNRLFYMALPPSVFIPVSQHLKRLCYPRNGIGRIVVSSYTCPVSQR